MIGVNGEEKDLENTWMGLGKLASTVMRANIFMCGGPDRVKGAGESSYPAQRRRIFRDRVCHSAHLGHWRTLGIPRHHGVNSILIKEL
jgi:hypothetical protein